MPKGNPHPIQTEEFKKKQFKPQGEITRGQPLASRAIAVRLPEDVDAAIRALPNEGPMVAKSHLCRRPSRTASSG
jgi:hypothetical protein